MTQAVTHVDRYERVGLRRNPFAQVDHDSDLAGQLFVERGLAVPPPPGSATLVQLVGAKGAGKTTHVQQWRRSVPGPYHYVPLAPYQQRWCRPPVEAMVYADEIDRMPALLRWRWFRRADRASSTIVAGTHVDLSSSARRAGLRVITHQLGPVDGSTLSEIVERRLVCAATVGAATRFEFSPQDLDDIVAKSRGVLRDAEGLCHELLAERVR